MLEIDIKKAAIVESEQMGALLLGVENMVHLINRCKLYELLYLDTNQPTQHDSLGEVDRKQLVTNLESALIEIYVTILQFLSKASRLYNKSLLTRTVYGILNPEEVFTFLGKCADIEIRLEKYGDLCERLDNRRLRDSSDNRLQQLQQSLASLEAPLLRANTRVNALYERLDDSEQL